MGPRPALAPAAGAFTDTFAGIAPTSVGGFVLAQLAGAVLGVVAVILLYPDRPRAHPNGVQP